MKEKKCMFLICNAHLDPVWQWEWEEGLSAALSTFRTAADLAEEFDYIFCHNEALLYEWIEEHDPALFQRIVKLIEEKKWRIMGGWYLQPDCNMPCGESFIRQILAGNRYFKEKFNAVTTTAVNFDSFGHNAGLPQIMQKCGYDSYIICRPMPNESTVPDIFIWEGADGSQVKVSRVNSMYLSARGKAAWKAKEILRKNPDDCVYVTLWGVGNHGGGPSIKDLEDLRSMIAENDDTLFVKHSYPEEYMAAVQTSNHVKGSLYPCNVGCYTSQIRIKQQHRKLENQLFFAEKICLAASEEGMRYPYEELLKAEKALLFTQFHDILPGSSIKAAEESALRKFAYALEILNTLRARAFMYLIREEKRANPGEYPIIVFNPHPFPVNAEIEVSIMMDDQNWEGDFSHFTAYNEKGDALNTQIIKEDSSMPLDWSRKIVFSCELAPMAINRFDCRKHMKKDPPLYDDIADKGFFFDNGIISARISREGFLISLISDGKEMICGNAFVPMVYSDVPDSWGSIAAHPARLGHPISPFTLCDTRQSTLFSGQGTVVPPLRIVEDGDVYTALEALFKHENSFILITYYFYKKRNYIDIKAELLNAEKDKLIKMSVSTSIYKGVGEVQSAFCREQIPCDGGERCMQHYAGILDEERCLYVINDGIYGVSISANIIELSLLRSVGYTVSLIPGNVVFNNQRAQRKMDQGERVYNFRLIGGKKKDIHPFMDNLALVVQQPPYALNVFPYGEGRKQRDGSIALNGDTAIVLAAAKRNESGDLIVRLYNPTEAKASCTLKIRNAELNISLEKYKFDTFKYREGRIIKCEIAEI